MRTYLMFHGLYILTVSPNGSSLGSFIRSVIPFMRSPPSWTICLQKAPLLHTSTLWITFQYMNFREPSGDWQHWPNGILAQGRSRLHIYTKVGGRRTRPDIIVIEEKAYTFYLMFFYEYVSFPENHWKHKLMARVWGHHAILTKDNKLWKSD